MDTTVDELLKQDPEIIKNWLKNEWSTKISTTKDVNYWLGLAQRIAHKVSAIKEDNDDKLKWTQIAISIYEYLSNQVDIKSRDAFEVSSMNLRAVMIRQFGVIPGHSVLDLDTVVEWFIIRLPVSLEKAREMVIDWQKRPIDEIRQLRNIKNRLRVIELLMKDGYLQDNDDLAKWIEINNKLP